MSVTIPVEDRSIEQKTGPAQTPFLDITIYHPCYDVALPSRRGVTRLAHVVVSRYGIFVVETVFHSGWIGGDAASPSWTTVYPNHKRYRFPNPLRRCDGRLRRLAAALGMPREKVFPVLVFRGDCELAAGVPANVVKADPARYIRTRREPVFTEEEVADIREKLKDFEKKAALLAARHPPHAR